MRRFLQRGHVVVWAPAKVNLFLEVLGKRPDGYHEIATLMTAVRLYDTLTFTDDACGELQLSADAPELSTGPDNLVLRAARLLQQHCACKRGARIRLVKRIPIMAGLAGGSTDAAATLLGLNDLWGTGLSVEELARLGGQLGSDVPFFFHLPAAWCTGRGEIVTEAPAPKSLDLVLVCPNFGCSTPAIYKGVEIPKEPRTGVEIREALDRGEVEEVGRRLFNRLQPAAQQIAPKLTEVLETLEALGPVGQMMSGSGSSVFAVCRSPEEAGRIAREMSSRADEGFKVFVLRSCSEQLPP
jgi:4-diphosphocytidyl-2-C-methyl-D-erythritol kinase